MNNKKNIKKQIQLNISKKIPELNEIIKLANKIVSENLNVRDIELIAHNINLPKKGNIKNNNYEIYENIMREKIGTKVKINGHHIDIPFDSQKDLERILEILDIKIEGE